MRKNYQKSSSAVWWITGLIAVIFVFLIIKASKNSNSLKTDISEGERSGQTFPIQGQQHIQIGASHPAYNSNPPTSGWHYPQPANWGVYQEELPDEQVIHNLEHGGIWISYKDIDEATKAKLETIGKQNPRSVIVTPRTKNDSKITLASWGRLQKLDQFYEKIILDYIKANKNKSPEPLAH